MHSRKLLSGLSAVVLVVGSTGACRYALSADKQSQQAEAGESRHLRISGPYTHENLGVYLVHGKDVLKSRSFLTLQAALEQKKVRVHETGNVNELAIENLSKNEEIFIQAGEIVRGGKQDRVLSVDLIVAARSGEVPVGAFCVEQGRWRRRGAEPVDQFFSSANLVPSNAMKLAITKECDQSVVWREVAGTQTRLAHNVGGSVASEASETSLELSLESPEVQRAAAAYASKLSRVIDGKDDAVGLVVAINAQLYSADVYASPRLFRKLWPKLLEASVTEAIASQRDKKAPKLPTIADVQQFLNAGGRGRAATKAVSSRVRMVTRESNDSVVLETFDAKDPSVWVHRNYIRKPTVAEKKAPPR